MKKKLVASVAVLAFALTACGGGGGRPSQDDIAKAIKDQVSQLSASSAVSDDMIDCIAKEVHDSDLSDDTLNKMVDQDKGSTDETAKATQVVTDAAQKCITS